MGFLAHNGMKFADTEQNLRSVKLPQATRTYQPIAHGDMIDWMKQGLRDNGLRIRSSQFISGADGKQMGCFFEIDGGEANPDITYQLAGMNSYDKSIAATIAGGGNVVVCSNGMFVAESSIKRKHTSLAAVTDVKEFVNKVLAERGEVLERLTWQKEQFRLQPLSTREMAELAGRLYVEERLINTYEITALRNEIDKPSFDYGGDNNTAWDFYNHVTVAFKKTQPAEYQSKHRQFNELMLNEFSLAD